VFKDVCCGFLTAEMVVSTTGVVDNNYQQLHKGLLESGEKMLHAPEMTYNVSSGTLSLYTTTTTTTD